MVDETEIVKSPQEARQARHVGLKNVLIWGLILVVVAFAIVYVLLK